VLSISLSSRRFDLSACATTSANYFTSPMTVLARVAATGLASDPPPKKNRQKTSGFKEQTPVFQIAEGPCRCQIEGFGCFGATKRVLFVLKVCLFCGQRITEHFCATSLISPLIIFLPSAIVYVDPWPSWIKFRSLGQPLVPVPVCCAVGNFVLWCLALCPSHFEQQKTERDPCPHRTYASQVDPLPPRARPGRAV
jgi:hypothetical protein